MGNWQETIMSQNEVCKHAGCAIANKVVDDRCRFSDTRACPIFQPANLAVQKQAEITWRVKEAEITKLRREATIAMNHFVNKYSKETEKRGMQKVVEWVKKYKELAEHGDYSNGNEEGGLDEGRVLAGRLLDNYEKEWQKFLKDEGLEVKE